MRHGGCALAGVGAAGAGGGCEQGPLTNAAAECAASAKEKLWGTGRERGKMGGRQAQLECERTAKHLSDCLQKGKKHFLLSI